jgi:hypothetical protein
MKTPVAFQLMMTVLLGAAACGTTEELNRCIDDRVTIQHGVYGQLINGCDTEDCTASYAVGMELRVYDADPTPVNGTQGQGTYDTGTTLTPIKRTSAGAEGFYEIALAPATYYLCTNSCAQLVLLASASRVRLDWASGPGGGYWWEGACSSFY